MALWHLGWMYVFYVVAITAIANFSSKSPNPPLVPVGIWVMAVLILLAVVWDLFELWVKNKKKNEWE